MADTGATSGSSFSNVDLENGALWTNPENAAASDNQYATASVNGGSSDGLLATGFGFSVPTTALIAGVHVEVEVKSTGASSQSVSACRLYNSGSSISSSRDGTSGVGTSDAYITVGGTTDKWGAALSPSVVNSATFGVRVGVTEDNGSPETFSIDHVRITIYYSVPLTIEEDSTDPSKSGWKRGVRVV